MLTLKLILVPAFLLLLTLAGKRWGPSVAGWLAGLPVVAGPILFFLSLEQGVLFAANAATAALSAVLASVAFSVAYSRAAQRWPWPQSLLLALIAWSGSALCLSALPACITLSLVVAMFTLIAAPRLFPCTQFSVQARAVTIPELGCRVLAGAALTLAVTFVAGTVGSEWSGLLAVFPVLGIVLAVFSHRTQGPTFAASLLRGMATGLYSFVAFCFILSVGLPHFSIPIAFTGAVLVSLFVQVASKKYLVPASSGVPPAPSSSKP
ncbi:MAG: hypothetical protein EOO23_00880 [Comamonadaceae bacterium]|nr:MAG: hypothetical protein EOO23_00880 [Comamonadaceae bacterium]